MGWIKSLRKGTTGIGYTFETMLGKKEDTLVQPDYKSIEIKVKRRYGKGYITLFNAVPDNKEKVILEIYKKYGISNKNKNYFKTFMINIDSKNYSKQGKHLFKLKVDYLNKVIRLEVYDLNKNKIRDNIYWSFQLLNEKINKKMKNLAIVKADIKKINEEFYYKYYAIHFYEIKSLFEFIKAIDAGYIRITFKISVFDSGEKTGDMDDHGTGFDINEKDILQIYKKKYN